MSTREIISIQCGHYSNFVGTHWWNLQESAFCYDDSTAKEPREILTDCMFREGLTLKGEQTYTPRLLAVDLSGSLKTLKKGGHLYDDTPASTTEDQMEVWHGKVEKHTMETPKKNEFLSDLQLLDSGKMEAKDLENKVYEICSNMEVWSDFLRLHLHPKSVLTVPGVFHGCDDFKLMPSGQSVWNATKFQDSFEERLHFFIEECDSLQGFHLLADMDDGFGGLGSCIAELLADEYSQKATISFALSPRTKPLDQAKNEFHSTLLNHALCLNELSTHTSLVCPLSLLVNPWSRKTHPSLRPFPQICYEESLPFHTAAVLASALETASLLYRTHQAPLTLSSLADTFSKMGRKMCSMGLCLPLSLPPDSNLLSEFDCTPLHTQLQPLTPFCTVDDLRWSQAISVRGIPPTYPLCSPKDQRSTCCRHHPTLALSTHLSQHFPSSAVSTHFTVIHKPLVLGNPFPPILPDHYHKTKQAPASASFQSQSGIGDMLSALSSELKRLDVRKMAAFASTCLDSDSYRELKEKLVSMEKCYRTELDVDDSPDSS